MTEPKKPEELDKTNAELSDEELENVSGGAKAADAPPPKTTTTTTTTDVVRPPVRSL